MSMLNGRSFLKRTLLVTVDNQWTAPKVGERPFTPEIRQLFESKGAIFTPEQLRRFAKRNEALGFASPRD
jgi:hypothetical protein